MKKALLGKKVGMTQVFDSEGDLVPVTVVEAGPCVVVQRRVAGRDGYSALQLGLEELKESKVNKPTLGHFARANVGPMRYLQEVSVDNVEDYEVGQVLEVSIFEANERVDISGITRGKGFQGVIKRHGFHRGPMSHGSRHHRAPGSHGASADPSRVFKGRRLPGHMGGERVTTQNLQIVRVDPERNVLLVKGSVPGAKGSLLKIQSSVKERR